MYIVLDDIPGHVNHKRPFDCVHGCNLNLSCDSHCNKRL